MNILIPHSWLLEYLDTDATPEKIQECLSLSGPSVERILEKEGEPVYDIEVTTNRPDSLSVRGIAQEAAVILKQFGVTATFKQPSLPEPKLSGPAVSLPQIHSNPSLCGRVICIVLKDIQQTPTPEWMAKRLRMIDLNVHNSAIDITNYVTHAIGHPCHAFDYDKVMSVGGEINIVEAKAGETFATLDGLEFETVGGEVVFKNGEGAIIDLPSIKGTANTSIDDSTTTVLLLLESIRADKVRFASMTHSIRTVAAQLMEKQIDPHLAQDVLFAASELYQDLCHATVGSEIHDEFPADQKPDQIQFNLAAINRYLGITIPQEQVVEILTDLGCQVEPIGESDLAITPPTYRGDLKMTADIVEEVARIYGYPNIPSVMMSSALPLNPRDDRFDLEQRLKTILSLSGWQEVYTYSLVSEAVALQSGYALRDHVALLNPLSEDRVYLRRSLIPSLVEALEANPLRKDLSVFEIANEYHPIADSLPTEKLKLTLVSRQSYRTVRGVLELVLQKLFIDKNELEIAPIKTGGADLTSPTSTSQIGVINLLRDKQSLKVGQAVILENEMVAIDLDLHQLFSIAQSHPNYTPIAKTSPVVEDLTFTLPAKTEIGPILTQIRSLAPEISRVEVKDTFQQNVTFTIWYLDPNENMSNERVEPIRQHLVTAVEQQWQATLVGSI
ncbi:phenylalanine--tRNA ligase subunit beta [Candidatus Woesebacteria bacterium]|nr:phenylalanine--tRNA ligase subunit beta [Candidatus Woesebacteria bacterium]